MLNLQLQKIQLLKKKMESMQLLDRFQMMTEIFKNLERHLRLVADSKEKQQYGTSSSAKTHHRQASSTCSNSARD